MSFFSNPMNIVSRAYQWIYYVQHVEVFHTAHAALRQARKLPRSCQFVKPPEEFNTLRGKLRLQRGARPTRSVLFRERFAPQQLLENQMPSTGFVHDLPVGMNHL